MAGDRKPLKPTSVALDETDIEFLKNLAVSVFYGPDRDSDPWLRQWDQKPSISGAVRWLVEQEKRRRRGADGKVVFSTGLQDRTFDPDTGETEVSPSPSPSPGPPGGDEGDEDEDLRRAPGPPPPAPKKRARPGTMNHSPNPSRKR